MKPVHATRPASLWAPTLLLAVPTLLALAAVGGLREAALAVAGAVLCAVPWVVGPCLLMHALVALADRWVCGTPDDGAERLLPLEGPLLLVALAHATARVVTTCLGPAGGACR